MPRAPFGRERRSIEDAARDGHEGIPGRRATGIDLGSDGDAVMDQ